MTEESDDAVFAGLVGWAGEGPCPCNIAVRVRGCLTPLARNGVVFTTVDAEVLRQALREARAAERAKTVAWLRDPASYERAYRRWREAAGDAESGSIGGIFAAAIERGDHVRGSR